jgi:hypothetical protein
MDGVPANRALREGPSMNERTILDQLNQKMEDLSLEGFSSMGTFSPEDQLAQLDEIERIIEGRRQRSCSTAGQDGAESPPRA